jgi:hypothetical protein
VCSIDEQERSTAGGHERSVLVIFSAFMIDNTESWQLSDELEDELQELVWIAQSVIAEGFFVL